MNYRHVLRQLGLLLGVLSLAMAGVTLLSLAVVWTSATGTMAPPEPGVAATSAQQVAEAPTEAPGEAPGESATPAAAAASASSSAEAGSPKPSDLPDLAWIEDDAAAAMRVAGEDDAGLTALGAGCVACLGLGGLLWLVGLGSGDASERRREAVMLVGLAWFALSAVAALPYYWWAHWYLPSDLAHPFKTYVDCYFEAVSGLTTTGATVLSDIPTVPEPLLLWRSMTHWLGGLGIVVLFVAVLPMLGVGGKRLYQAEATGPTKKGLRPRIGETARVLWGIYTLLTASAALLFYATGGPSMTWLDAFHHALSVMSTGGLSTKNASIGHFDSAALDYAVSLFMLVAGVNFGLFYQAVKGRWQAIWTDAELRVYLAVKVIAITAITISLWGGSIVMTSGQTVDGTIDQALRFATFQVVSLQTGTGFGTADYEYWSTPAVMALMSAMFVGGCAGSTAGGVKVIRFWITIKVLAASIERVYRPNVVRPIRVGGVSVERDQRLGAVGFVLLFFLLFFAGSGVLMVFEPSVAEGGRCDFSTAMSASVATLCNIGPGLHAVGPTDNYGWFSSPSLPVLSLLMVLGRLEVLVVLALFHPSLYRRD